jgi:hypothetical protein
VHCDRRAFHSTLSCLRCMTLRIPMDLQGKSRHFGISPTTRNGLQTYLLTIEPNLVHLGMRQQRRKLNGVGDSILYIEQALPFAVASKDWLQKDDLGLIQKIYQNMPQFMRNKTAPDGRLRKPHSTCAIISRRVADLFPLSSSKPIVPAGCLCASNT